MYQCTSQEKQKVGDRTLEGRNQEQFAPDVKGRRVMCMPDCEQSFEIDEIARSRPRTRRWFLPPLKSWSLDHSLADERERRYRSQSYPHCCRAITLLLRWNQGEIKHFCAIISKNNWPNDINLNFDHFNRGS